MLGTVLLLPSILIEWVVLAEEDWLLNFDLKQKQGNSIWKWKNQREAYDEIETALRYDLWGVSVPEERERLNAPRFEGRGIQRWVEIGEAQAEHAKRPN